MGQTSVLGQELNEIRAARLARRTAAQSPPKRSHDGKPLPFATNEHLEQAADEELFGLALSGGGIRSATFNLGVLQALAQLKILSRIDYLSTVSGGGYIGAWLTAWVHRTNEAEGNGRSPTNPEIGIVKVEHELEESLNNGNKRPLRFLREHSNYLTPRTGFFGADTWSAVSIYARNLTLNLSILIGVFVGILLAARLLLVLLEAAATWHVTAVPFGVADGIGFTSMLVAVLVSGLNLRDVHRTDRRQSWFANQSAILLLVILPAAISAFFITASMYGSHATIGWQFWELLSLGSVYLILWSVVVFTWLWPQIRATLATSWQLRQLNAITKRLRSSIWITFGSAVCAAVGASMAVALVMLVEWAFSDFSAASWVTFGVPAVIAIFSVSAIVFLGLMGKDVSEEVREWWSRLGGWLLIVDLAWIGFFCIALFGAPLLQYAGTTLNVSAAAVWVATSAFGALAGRSPSTSGKGSNRLVEIVATVAPYVFVVGLLLLLSWATDWVLVRLVDSPGSEFEGLTPIGWEEMRQVYLQRMHEVPSSCVLVSMIATWVVAWTLSYRVDINTFSLQPLYRNRLVRCYLGASRKRTPHPFTGFDPHDDIKLAELAADGHVLRPYPLINVAMNLVKGENLAWQERKAASFTLAPLHCGFCEPGRPDNHGDADKQGSHGGFYRPTKTYARGELTLGQAFATSGAAASPNMGYHSSPALAFLMTMFNVRLGMWLTNPANGNDEWANRFGPPSNLRALFDELFGNTTSSGPFVYLSDGGHFDNLGIYELVRRRCRFIIACDASADPRCRFDDLGSAIRKCRTDFNVEITLDAKSLRLDPETKHSSYYCAVGEVHYPDGTPGVLLYLKALLTGREAMDVLNYAASDDSFPHQSTADQWFDESQFESYRRLGHHAAHTALEAAVRGEPSQSAAHSLNGAERPLESIFTALKERWYPPTGVTSGTFVHHAAALDDLTERIRQHPRLSFLDGQIIPSWRELMSVTKPPPLNLWLPDDAETRRDGFYLSASLLQFMENVYVDLGLELHYAHPDNRGWMNLFRHWSWCGMVRVTWALTAATYGARFQTFCRDRLNLDIGRVEVKPASPEELNFLERELAQTAPRAQLFGVKLCVDNPMATEAKDRGGGGDPSIEFLVGFALIDGDRLLYLRIQDHLRKMGLARKALRYLMENGLAAHQDPANRPPSSEHEPSADGATLTRLFHSVRTEIVQQKIAARPIRMASDGPFSGASSE